MKTVYIGKDAYARLSSGLATTTTLTPVRAFGDDYQLIPVTGDWINAEDVMRSAKRLDVLLNGDKAAQAPLLIDVTAQLEKDLPVLLSIAATAKLMIAAAEAEGLMLGMGKGPGFTEGPLSKRLRTAVKKVGHLL